MAVLFTLITECFGIPLNSASHANAPLPHPWPGPGSEVLAQALEPSAQLVVLQSMPFVPCPVEGKRAY